MDKCPQCQSNIPIGNKNCNNCGYQINKTEKQIKSASDASVQNMKILLIGVFVSMGLIGLVAGLIIERSPQVIKINSYPESVDVKCFDSTDCKVPGEYAIQSNCPYQSFCYNYECVVVCPIPTEIKDGYFKYYSSCDNDDDCDCSVWDRELIYDCKCLEQQCVSIVDIIE